MREGITAGGTLFGTTFFVLTGFHGLHVTLGATMLLIILLRAMKGHFTAEHHFAFEAVAWYWHFVDVVWLFLFAAIYGFAHGGLFTVMSPTVAELFGTGNPLGQLIHVGGDRSASSA